MYGCALECNIVYHRVPECIVCYYNVRFCNGRQHPWPHVVLYGPNSIQYRTFCSGGPLGKILKRPKVGNHPSMAHPRRGPTNDPNSLFLFRLVCLKTRADNLGLAFGLRPEDAVELVPTDVTWTDNRDRPASLRVHCCSLLHSAC